MIEETKEKMRRRAFGLDLIRALAIVFVLFIHGMEYTDLLMRDYSIVRWSSLVFLRYMVMTCVPLFLMLSGYLQKDKMISKDYYKSLIPLVVTYFIVAIVCVIAKYTQGVHTPFWKSVVQIFNYTANSYGWYVEMYIGLFLLIPFLNSLYKGLADQKAKWMLVGTLIGMTLLPSVFQSIGTEELIMDVLPDYWKFLYPVTYYYLGTLISEYQPKMKKVWNSLLCIGLILVPTLLCVWTSHYTGTYAWWVSTDYTSLFNAGIAVSIFMLCYDLKCENRVIRSVVKELAICSYEIYLISYLTDQLVYKTFEYPQVVLMSMSLIGAYIGSKLLRMFMKTFVKRY